jgi:hypothetical protein
MAKSTKSPKNPPAKADAAPSSFRLPAWAPTAAWSVALCGTAVALAIAVPRLLERVRTASLPAPIRVVLRNEPSWLPKDERTAIERGILKTVSASPFDRDGLVAARDLASRCGWYSEVRQVHRSDVDEVIVDGTWAIPFALVCDASGDHLVDTHGRLLPRNYPAGRGPAILRITGVSMPMPATVGKEWPGDEVAAALSMAALIADRPWHTQVSCVDVSGWSRDGLLRLRTDRGCEITWGRAPGKESAAEVPSSQKLGALQLAFDRMGRIDASAPNALDLRGDLTMAR